MWPCLQFAPIKYNKMKKIDLLIQITDRFLSDNGLGILCENNDFIAGELNYSDYKYFAIAKKDTIKLRFEFTSDGVEIGVNEHDGLFFFSYENIYSDSPLYQQYLYMLLFGSIVVQKCLGCSTIFHLKADGELQRIERMYEGVLSILFLPISLIPIFYTTHQYIPIYNDDDEVALN
jgi:hypothetical protein